MQIFRSTGAEPMKTIRPFTDTLRKLGDWVPDGDSRTGGIRTVFFNKQVTSRRSLRLQLWGDGQHRVDHIQDGYGTTEPTLFTDVPSMLNAIEFETVRPSRGRPS